MVVEGLHVSAKLLWRNVGHAKNAEGGRAFEGCDGLVEVSDYLEVLRTILIDARDLFGKQEGVFNMHFFRGVLVRDLEWR